MAKVAAKYGKLTEDEIKSLVVDDKWLATLAAAVQGELDRVRRHSPAASANSPNATPHRCRSSPAKSRRSPPAWMNTSRRWARYGSEARLQADEMGMIPEEWDVSRLGDMQSSFGSGIRHSRRKTLQGGCHSRDSQNVVMGYASSWRYRVHR